MLVIPDTAVKTYEGKSKDVWRLDDGTVILDFNKNFQTVDPITGLPDPGANSNGKEEVPGLGRTNLALTYLFFKLFEASGIKTQLIDSDIENGLMHVKPLEMFGKDIIIPELATIQPVDPKKNISHPYWHTIENASLDGIEVIARRRFTGSFLKAFYGAVYNMMGINPSDPAFIEFTIKNDALGDPRIMAEQLVGAGIMTEEEVIEIINMTRDIEQVAQEVSKKHGLELIDFKIEYGKNNEGILLADEFATGSWRMQGLDSSEKGKFQVASAFLGEQIIDDIRANKTDGLNDQIMNKGFRL